jgi:6-phosphofructokinase 2
MPPIVTLTPNPALDVATEVERLEYDLKLRCGPARMEAGGGGVNVARAIGRLGGDALAIHACGGPSGAMVGSFLEAEGVPQRRVPIAGATRENVSVLERATGRRLRLVLPGPELGPDEWRALLDAAVAADAGPYLVASGSLPPGAPDDLYARLARALEPAGTRLLLDTSGPALRAALEGGVHLVKPNFRELDELGGGGPLDDAGRERLAARIVREGGARIVVVTLGPRGALVVTAEGPTRIAAPVVERPDSPVGAGDSFMAGLALALDAGCPLADAAALGVASAAAAMLTPGTEPCRARDVEAMFARATGRPPPVALGADSG